MFQARNARTEHLLLWGPMGVGKSSVAAALAPLLQRPCFDLDRSIEAEAGLSIAELFRREGEAGFRRRERDALEMLLAAPTPSVIALGGGTLLDVSLRERALRTATVLGLSADVATLVARLRADSNQRPLFDGEFEARMAARKDAYAAHHWCVSASASIETIAATLAERVREGLVPMALEASTGAALSTTSQPARAAAEVLGPLRPTSLILITDSNVAALHAPAFTQALAAHGLPLAATLTFPAGEANKTLRSAQSVLQQLVEVGADRGSLLLGLGGGVVTDLTGFVASIFLRGVRWLAIPTTTMGLADAATGGKTGVDLDFAKNLVGTVHPPIAVLIDSSWVATEMDRAVRSGLAEVVKIAAVADADLFGWLEAHTEQLAARAPDAITYATARSAALKARFVEADPREQRGVRALLNFGHTLGHALESAALERAHQQAHATELMHGEAVAIGMAAACALGIERGVTSGTCRRVPDLLTKLGLPTDLPEALRSRAAELLAADKKRYGATLRFILLSELGHAHMQELPLAEVRAFLTAVRSNTA